MKKTIVFLLSFCLYSGNLFATTEAKTTLLEDLGIHYDENKITDEQMDKLLEERTYKLDLHPTFGHITAGLMLASLFTGFMAKQRDRNQGHTGGSGMINLHRNLSYITALSYYYTGYLSLTAPKPTDFEDGHSRKIHKHLAYVHATAMILVPILGTIAYSQRKKDGKTSGVGKLAGPVMYVGAAAFFGAWTVMTF